MLSVFVEISPFKERLYIHFMQHVIGIFAIYVNVPNASYGQSPHNLTQHKLALFTPTIVYP